MRLIRPITAAAFIGATALTLAGCRNPATGEEYSWGDVTATVQAAIAENPDITPEELGALLRSEFGFPVRDSYDEQTEAASADASASESTTTETQHSKEANTAQTTEDASTDQKRDCAKGDRHGEADGSATSDETTLGTSANVSLSWDAQAGSSSYDDPRGGDGGHRHHHRRHR